MVYTKSMEEQKAQIKEWLDATAEEMFGEFGFTTCDEDQQLTLISHLVNSILHAK